MNRKKCKNCGLVNFATETFCKKCKKSLEEFDKSKHANSLGKFELKSRISIYAILLLLIGGILVSITIFFAVLLQGKVGNNESEFLLMVITFGVIPALCCFYTLKFFLGVKKISIHENGFIYSEKSKETIVFWSEIKSISETIEWFIVEGIPIGRGTVMNLKTNSDEEIILMQDIGGLRKIRKNILRKCKTANYIKNRKFDISVSI